MRLKGYDNVFALGDCAHIPDPDTGKPYPPTAQHSIREGKAAALNIAMTVKGEKQEMEKFSYKTKGVMATVGEKSGVAVIFGIKLQGFAAWWLWRTFCLANLPTVHKKLRVMSDWTTDLLFKHDVSKIKLFANAHAGNNNNDDDKNNKRENSRQP